MINFTHHLFVSSPPLYSVFLFFTINVGITLIFTSLILKFLTLSVVKKRREFALLVFSIGCFIPIFGILFILVVVILIEKYAKDFHPIEISVFPQIEYSRKNPVKFEAYAPNWANVRLYSKDYSDQERTEALHSISRSAPREANLIFSSLVSDDSEELRICAFSMLENQQDYLQKEINVLLKIFDEIVKPHKKAFIAKQIALLYWELVYRNLSDKEFRVIFLDRSRHFAHLALENLTSDATLFILLARIHFEKKEYVPGLGLLKEAIKLGGASSKITPYLAEFAYEQKDYKQVKYYLQSDPSFAFIFKLNKVVNFWCAP